MAMKQQTSYHLLRAAKLFYPNSLETSYSSSNNPVFKLEDLGMKNFPETDKSLFHTATQDVEISAKIMQKLKGQRNQYSSHH